MEKNETKNQISINKKFVTIFSIILAFSLIIFTVILLIFASRKIDYIANIITPIPVNNQTNNETKVDQTEQEDTEEQKENRIKQETFEKKVNVLERQTNNMVSVGRINSLKLNSNTISLNLEGNRYQVERFETNGNNIILTKQEDLGNVYFYSKKDETLSKLDLNGVDLSKMYKIDKDIVLLTTYAVSEGDAIPNGKLFIFNLDTGKLSQVDDKGSNLLPIFSQLNSFSEIDQDGNYLLNISGGDSTVMFGGIAKLNTQTLSTEKILDYKYDMQELDAIEIPCGIIGDKIIYTKYTDSLIDYIYSKSVLDNNEELILQKANMPRKFDGCSVYSSQNVMKLNYGNVYVLYDLKTKTFDEIQYEAGYNSVNSFDTYAGYTAEKIKEDIESTNQVLSMSSISSDKTDLIGGKYKMTSDYGDLNLIAEESIGEYSVSLLEMINKYYLSRFDLKSTYVNHANGILLSNRGNKLWFVSPVTFCTDFCSGYKDIYGYVDLVSRDVYIFPASENFLDEYFFGYEDIMN